MLSSPSTANTAGPGLWTLLEDLCCPQDCNAATATLALSGLSTALLRYIAGQLPCEQVSWIFSVTLLF
jgi:hypothetical protein